MTEKSKQYARRMLAMGGVTLGLLLTGCGKPATVKRTAPQNDVNTETGELPAAGKANRLVAQQSAFLRRHANDPVEWYPWGDEAFTKAKAENKPLLVSIGYASCPWSQKMHTETFLDAGVARFMNKHYVCVLVDREERPDVNTAFLHYSFWKAKISGWPLHMWLTPDGLPLSQGVYFPPHSEGSNPSWTAQINNVVNEWEGNSARQAEIAKINADNYLLEFRRRWLGPPPEGNSGNPGVKSFLAQSPAQQFKDFAGFNDDRLNFSIRDLPTATLEELWKKLTPAQAAAMTERLHPASAAILFSKLQSAPREPLRQRYIKETRQLNFQKLRGTLDPSYGGFGPPPRFAPHQALEFLVRYALYMRGDRFEKDKEAIKMLTLTVDKILDGGMRDQVGGGFHRYSTDVYWFVPQFEKMIYDQGYMAQALTLAGQVTGRREYLKAAALALEYANRDLSHPEGGFYCAEGSSSKGPDGKMAEGAFYVWSREEIEKVTGPAAPLVEAVFGIEARGNLPLDSPMRQRLGNTNVLAVKQSPEAAGKALGLDPAAARAQFEEARTRLAAARRNRPRPSLEDKVLTSWSGVAISGFARTGWALNDPALVERAQKAAEFILAKLRSPDGGLRHAFLDGASPLPGYSEDYATFINALLDLYDVTGAVRWLTAALQLQERQIADLWDKEDGGFFDGPPSPLIFHRMKSMDESSEISSGSSSLLNLVILHNMLNIADYRDKAARIVERYGPHSAISPGAFARFVRASEFLLEPPPQFVISGSPDAPGRTELLNALRAFGRPGSPLLYMDGAESEKLLLKKVPDLAVLKAEPGKAALHFCRGFKAEKSFTSAADLTAFCTEKFVHPAPPRP